MPQRLPAIGDIHGCLTQFDALLQSVAPTSSDSVVLLGDLIDRGPDSAGVLNRALQLSMEGRTTIVMGNHEQMMLGARVSQERFSAWLQNGGSSTLRSYAGVSATLQHVPAEHWYFLEKKLVDYHETDSHIFVHANAYPDHSMATQPEYMLRWEPCDQISAHESGKVIVCGHTPQKSGNPMNRGYAICLDTNAWRGGPLTCMDAHSGRIWQADATGEVRKSHISDFSEDE